MKQREGLSIRALTEDELAKKLGRQMQGNLWDLSRRQGDKWWTVEYSKKYKSVTKSFIQTVMSGGKSFCYAAFEGNGDGLVFRPGGILGVYE